MVRRRAKPVHLAVQRHRDHEQQCHHHQRYRRVGSATGNHRQASAQQQQARREAAGEVVDRRMLPTTPDMLGAESFALVFTGWVRVPRDADRGVRAPGLLTGAAAAWYMLTRSPRGGR